ncbi:hypothetical protein [Enterococcus sp. CWB-B31]|uniref:hypothetical protein n=1 Tax=Enterococcus sp. CWB-B31 TaxID=2885159 RepID=UPI001E560EFF|nr:hypothetical protein [Enterococcus sp. CWB-B31]MCB5954430.1 hypothetical protein [Enterococcus sp. CWB-B31]
MMLGYFKKLSDFAENKSEFASNQTDKAKKAINREIDQAKEQMETRVQLICN